MLPSVEAESSRGGWHDQSCRPSLNPPRRATPLALLPVFGGRGFSRHVVNVRV